MANTRDKVLDRAGGARPYIERALQDEDLRDNVRNAFESAREVYNELIGGRGAIPVATRVATDKDIQDRLREALDELREAADRVQGKKDHGTRNALLLITGIALGLLFNPVSGSQTRKWVSDKVFGPSDDFTYQGELDAEPELARSFFFELKLSPFTTRGLIARCREPGTSPSAVEMSVAASRIAPGFGAFPSECSGAHASPPAKLTS